VEEENSSCSPGILGFDLKNNMKKIKLNSVYDMIPEDLTGIIEWEDKEIWHIKNGILHNPNGPAIEYPDGGKEHWILDRCLTKREFEIFQIMWGRTLLEKTEELMEKFLDLIAMMDELNRS